MNYQEALDWLYATQQFGIKLGLEQPRKLLRETLAYPTANTKVIHVAGTNGKGSTCAIIDSLARACGTKTGLFTSPHLIDYRERIQINGELIPKATTLQYLTDLKKHCANWEHHPTFFELTLAVAMRHFRQKGCELIILETGMGGRLDATTAVPADLAVITPIALDHSQWLGDTLEAIASEKAGIILKNKPVLSSPQQPAAHSVIEQEANEKQAPIQFITEPLTGYRLNILGEHQQYNAALALAAAHAIGLPISTDTVRHALNSVTWAGRFERIPNSNIILDATHNPHAAEALINTWKEQFPNQKAHIIFGAVEGKSPTEVLSLISSIAAHIHFTPVNSPRSVPPKELISFLPENAPPHTIHSDLATAIQFTSSIPQPLLITGSLFLIGEAKAILTNQSVRQSTQ